MKKTILIIPVVLLLGLFLFKSDQFEQVERADEIAYYQCTKLFPLRIYYPNQMGKKANYVNVKLSKDDLKAYCTNHSIAQIPDDLFKNTPCIKEISFNFNRLPTIPLAIKNLPDLTTIYLGDNLITMIPDTLFQHNKLLKNIHLNVNLITNLDLNTFKSITYLNLTNNRIHTILPSKEQEMTIKRLELGLNDLITLDLNIFKSIRHLDLQNNRIVNILPVREEEPNYMHSLNLSQNKLMRFPIEVTTLQELTELDLQQNLIGSDPNLKNLPYEDFTKLTKLDLSFNRLDFFPKRLGKIPNLEVLYLSSNQMSGSVVFDGFKKLTRLKIEYQLIDNFTIEANTFPRLDDLDLSYNRIRTFQIKGRNDQLRYLNLKKNQLSSIPLSVNQLTQLTDLDLSFNQITTIPDLSSLQHLDELNLSSNKIKALPKCENISSNTLNLSNNLISVLDFNRINIGIRALILSSCPISSFKNLQRLPHLRRLNLEFTELKEFPLEIFDYLTGLEELNLKNTQISDETLLKIIEITKTKNIAFNY